VAVGFSEELGAVGFSEVLAAVDREELAAVGMEEQAAVDHSLAILTPEAVHRCQR
jgi:hypothetical protein